MMSDEIWKVITACPAYEVSSYGRVRRCLPGIKRTKPGNVLSTVGHRVRYVSVTLVFNRKRTYHQLHRLVCEAFHGPRPSPRHQAAHLNGNSHDNRAVNLAWVTPAENSSHRTTHGTQTRGVTVAGAKLSDELVRQIRQKHAAARYGYAETAKEYGVDRTLIGLIARNKIWKHVTI